MASTRRLAAILAADVVGYSRLMRTDEEGTHERLKAHLGELVNPKIAEHGGRIVKNTGDGLLAEFPSVVDAVRCAVEIQRGMAERNVETPADKRIEFRIGINLGDVIAEEHDIFGDGVNVAARLEALAEPGGICVSRVVRDQVRDRLDYAFVDMGEQSVKNIARPIRVYALRPGAVAELPTSVLSTVSISQPAVAPRLSIVVLPFTNLSDDREQQYFADGITEDLTTDLSRISGMFVISRNTAFTYRGKPIDTKQIGRELGVRYVLEGSVRRSGNRVRVNAQLIDVESDAHLWAERFDGDTADLFALQDEITRRIKTAVDAELIDAEATRRFERPDAFDYILRARSVLFKPRTPNTYRQAINLFERALTVDPQSVEAQTRLAVVLVDRVQTRSADYSATADLARAEYLIDQALAASPRSAEAHFAKAQVLRARNRWEQAIPEYEAALALNHYVVWALTGLGWCKLYGGSIEGVIPLAEQAIRRSPRDPAVGSFYYLIGTVYLLQSHIEKAIVWFEKACSAMPTAGFQRSHLASAYALKDETERATAELVEAKRLDGGDCFSTIARLKASPGAWHGVPRIRALYEATYFAGLRKAGMPEE